MSAVAKCPGSRGTEPFQSLDSEIAYRGFGFLHSKVRYLKILVIKTVKKKIQQVRNDGFCAFAFQQLHKIVVCRGQELYQNLADYSYAGFFYVRQFDILIKIFNNLSA